MTSCISAVTVKSMTALGTETAQNCGAVVVVVDVVVVLAVCCAEMSPVVAAVA